MDLPTILTLHIAGNIVLMQDFWVTLPCHSAIRQGVCYCEVGVVGKLACHSGDDWLRVAI